MLHEIKFRDEKRHLREMSVGDVFAIQRELKSKPSRYNTQVLYYQEKGLLQDPIPSFILEELADLREEDKAVRKTFLSDFYYEWLVSLDGIKFIIEMLLVDEADEEVLAGLCLNSENTTKIIELINAFGKKNYDTIQKAAEDKAGTKKKATKKKTTAKQKRVAKKKTKKNPRVKA